jgi:hypothetical protein
METREMLTTAFSGSVVWRTDISGFYDSNMGKLGNYKIMSKDQVPLGRLGLSHGTCWRILREDQKLKQFCAKLVPWLLTSEEQQQKFWLLKVSVISHPYDIPDLATCDIIWFLRMRKEL